MIFSLNDYPFIVWSEQPVMYQIIVIYNCIICKNVSNSAPGSLGQL